jgi:protein-L-isoaspartate(D-aspartate) O-methyltransferase
MPDFVSLRERMIERQIARRGITNTRILEAFRAVPRHAFVAPAYGEQAYGDHPLPIEAKQTISQPYIVALMIDAAEITAGDRVLEVGAGSGYAAAVISRIAAHVIGIERQAELAELARERLSALGYDNVVIVEADGSTGFREQAPYDAILAAASGSHVPAALVDQLKPAGRLVMPIGSPGGVQQLVKVTKRHDGSLQQSDLGPVRFVPLIGEEGWSNG